MSLTMGARGDCFRLTDTGISSVLFGLGDEGARKAYLARSAATTGYPELPHDFTIRYDPVLAWLMK
jgi:hypothetical protein